MRTKKVIVLPYDIAWQSAFEKIKGEIEEALDDLIIGIEHVGSTSVEGMSAKPCIDMDVIIKDYSVFDEIVRRLGAVGYIHEGDLGIKDREAFKYADKPHLMMHHLYVCPQYSEELRRHITFRDFLRHNPEAVKEYSLVKEKAAELYPNDIDPYIEYKSPCIEELWESLNIQRAASGEKIFCQSIQKFARRVYPLRRIFVTNDGKDSADSTCDEFLEIPLYKKCGLK